MRKFSTILISVLAIFAVIVVVLEIAFQNYKTKIDFLFDRIYKASDNTTLILIGNSHIGTLGNFIQNDSVKSLNLSIGGQDIFHQYLLVKKAIQVLPNLRIAIVGVDYDLLGYDFEISGQMFLDRQYYKHTDTMYDYSFASVLMAKSNFFRSNRDLSYLFSNKTSTIDVTENFIPLSNNLFTDDDCRKRALEHTKIKFDRNLIQKNLQYLRLISDVCNKNSIKLYFLVLPKRDCYYRYSASENIQIARKEWMFFCNTYHVRNIDLYWSKLFNDSDFIDADHLNEEGAQKVISFYLKTIQ